MPSAYDFRMRDRRATDGIPVDDATWRAIRETAARAGVSIEDP